MPGPWFRQHAPDLVGLLVPGRPDHIPDLFQALVIRFTVKTMRCSSAMPSSEYTSSRAGAAEASFSRDDLFFALDIFAQQHEGAELIELMQSHPLPALLRRVVRPEDREARVTDDAGMGASCSCASA